jgi:hypothetical protein
MLVLDWVACLLGRGRARGGRVGSWSQCAAKKSCRLSMNLNVGQAFQPSSPQDLPVQWTNDGRLENRPNTQAGKSALRACPGSWSQCIRKNERAVHEPPFRPRRRARPRLDGLFSRTSTSTRTSRFMVPMHGQEVVHALHEEAPSCLLRMPTDCLPSGHGRQSGAWISRKESFAADLKLSHFVGSSGELRGAENGKPLNHHFRRRWLNCAAGIQQEPPLET